MLSFSQRDRSCPVLFTYPNGGRGKTYLKLNNVNIPKHRPWVILLKAKLQEFILFLIV